MENFVKIINFFGKTYISYLILDNDNIAFSAKNELYVIKSVEVEKQTFNIYKPNDFLPNLPIYSTTNLNKLFVKILKLRGKEVKENKLAELKEYLCYLLDNFQEDKDISNIFEKEQLKDYIEALKVVL